MIPEWQQFVQNQIRLAGHREQPKLVCIDLQAKTTDPSADCADILNIGGYSDAVFEVLTAFFAGDSGRFVNEVEAVEL